MERGAARVLVSSCPVTQNNDRTNHFTSLHFILHVHVETTMLAKKEKDADMNITIKGAWGLIEP